MISKLNPTKLLKLTIALLAILILGTISCSSSSSNPVGTDLSNSTQLGPAASDASLSDSEGAVPAEQVQDLESADRTAQIFWYDYPEVEPNDNIADATHVWHAQMFTGTVDSVSDVDDYYKVTLPILPGSIYTHMTWDTGDWINLYIYDSTLTPVMYDNYDHPGPKELFAYELAAGTYYIRVKAFEGSATYQIKFGIGRQSGEPLNNSMLTTQSFPIGTDNSGYLRSVIAQVEDPDDYFIVDVLEGQNITAKLDWVGLYGTDLDLFIYDSVGTLKASSDGSAQPEVAYTGWLHAGIYFIRVHAEAGRAIYELDVEVRDPFILDPSIFDIYEIPIWTPPWPPVFEFDFDMFELGPEGLDHTLPPQFGGFDGFQAPGGPDMDMPFDQQFGF